MNILSFILSETGDASTRTLKNVLNLSTSFSGDCLPWPKKLLAESDHKILVENLEKFLNFGVTTKF